MKNACVRQGERLAQDYGYAVTGGAFFQIAHFGSLKEELALLLPQAALRVKRRRANERPHFYDATLSN